MPVTFDSLKDGLSSTATSLGWTHTCTGNNGCLVVATVGDLTSDLVTSVSYNSVALTKIAAVQVPLDRWLSLWQLLSPSTGNNTVIVGASGSTFLAGASASYAGVASVGTSSTNVGTAVDNLTLTASTAANNSWTVAMFAEDSGGTLTAGTGTTIRVNNSVTGLAIGDSNSDLSPGNHTLQATSVSAHWGGIIASFAPFGGPPIIVADPSDLTVDFGNSAVFTVNASSQTGNNLSYQWTENGTNIGSATNASVTINPTLSTDQNGVLAVSVWDVNGTTASANAVLRLNIQNGYYLQEDGVGKFTLEDGSGFYLLESWSTSAATAMIPPFWWGDLDGLGRRFRSDRLN